MQKVVHGIGIAALSLAAIRLEAADHHVSVGGASVRFDPQEITINAGDTVTWVSSSAQPHNVHANDDSFRCADGCDGDGHGGSGVPRVGPWSATLAFPHAGTFGYRCDPHASYGMVGVVHVVDGGGGGSSHVPITSAFTGAWYDPQQSGHGLFIEVLPSNQILAWWFTFTPDGQQAWFGNVGSIDGDTATVAAVQTQGGRWIPNFDPSTVTQPSWGTLTFQFTDCNHGEVSFTTSGPYGNGHMDLTRLTQPAGLACP